MRIVKALIGTLAVLLAVTAFSQAALALTPGGIDSVGMKKAGGDRPHATPIPGHYIVVLKDTVDHPGAVAEAQVDSHDGELGLVYRHALKGYSAELSKGEAQALRQNPKVKSVTLDQRVEAFSQEIPTGISRTFDTENEIADIDGEDTRVNVDVAVIDSGIDYTHPDLNVVARANCVPASEDLYKDGSIESCVENAGTDLNKHGTHVAGTIGALDNDQGVVGIAPGARLWAVRVLNKEGSGSFAWIIAGIDWVTAHASEIEVANMSLGCTGWCEQPALEEAIESSIEAGVVYAVAAGNDGQDAAETIPASYPDVITVSALFDSDGKPGGEGSASCRDYEDDHLAPFSNWGSDVDIAAPGGCILSTLPGGEYGTLSGTSMASPHVAGAAALLASKSNPNSKKDVEAIRDQLVEGASLDMFYTNPGPPAPLLYLGDEPLTDVEAVTGGANGITAFEATINGAIRPQGLKTDFTLEWGKTSSYGKTFSGTIAVGESFARVSKALTGLDADTTYHYRLTATNSAGTFNGSDQTFTTGVVALTFAPTGIGPKAATFHGALYLDEWPEYETTSYHFEYGRSTDYGQSVPAEIYEAESTEESIEYDWLYGDSYDVVSADLTDLDETTVYHYRLVATNGHGTFYGHDIRLRTATWKDSQPEKINGITNISCPSANECMIIEPELGARSWDGKSWTSTPETPLFMKRDISCVSASACMVVGRSGDGIVPWGKESENLHPKAMLWDGKKWSETPDPPLPSEAFAGTVNGVTCFSATSCVAVGYYAVKYGPGFRTQSLAMHWDGSKWTLDSLPPSPFPADEYGVYDVSCISASNCLAVGSEGMHWDGSKWSIEPEAVGTGISCVASSFCMVVGGGARTWDGKEWSSAPFGPLSLPGKSYLIEGVSCAASWSCVAVGEEESWFNPSHRSPVAVHWDGSEWSREGVPLEKTEGHGTLRDVACTSVTHCVAVGSTLSLSGDGLIEYYDHAVAAPAATTDAASSIGASGVTLNAEINGGALHTTYQFEYDTSEYKVGEGSHGTKAPAPSKSIGSGTATVNVSETISGLSPKTTYHYRVVATNGEGTTYGKDQTLTTWSSWSTQTTPNPPVPPGEAKLEGTSCASSTMCLAVGEDKQRGKALGEAWNGSSWTRLFSGTEIPGSRTGVACTSTTLCMVVGSEEGKAVAERWMLSGETWVRFSTWKPGAPSGATEVKLRDVSCTSTSACTAVGSYVKEGVTKTLAERFNGTEWQLQTTPNPESGSASLLGVSCDSATSCTAVGTQGTASYAMRWNGSSWSATTLPSPSGATTTSLADVSCTASTFCVAVGNYKESTGYAKTLVEKWNGTSWSVSTSPNPAENKGSFLFGVSCTSSSACTTVGRYVTAVVEGIIPTKSATLVESWGGAEWQIQSSPNPSGKDLPLLNGVSCSASNACTAVGWSVTGLGSAEMTTLGERYQ